MEDVFEEVRAAQALLESEFEEDLSVVVHRGQIKPAADVPRPLFVGVSLRGMESPEDVDGAPSVKEAFLSVMLAHALSDYDEEDLYAYVARAVAKLEGADWVFNASMLGISKEGAKAIQEVRLETSKVIL